MAEIIRVDYDRLAQIGQRFTQQEVVTRQTLTRLNQNMENLTGEWIGRGSDAFFAEMEQDTLPGIGRLAHALQQASVAVNQIMSVLQEAEQEAAAPFAQMGSAMQEGRANEAVPASTAGAQPTRRGRPAARPNTQTGSTDIDTSFPQSIDNQLDSLVTDMANYLQDPNNIKNVGIPEQVYDRYVSLLNTVDDHLDHLAAIANNPNLPLDVRTEAMGEIMRTNSHLLTSDNASGLARLHTLADSREFQTGIGAHGGPSMEADFLRNFSERMSLAHTYIFGSHQDTYLFIPAPDVDILAAGGELRGDDPSKYKHMPFAEIGLEMLSRGVDPSQMVYLNGNNAAGSAGDGNGHPRLDDLVNFVDGPLGDGDIHLLGHSSGGNIAARYAAVNQESIQSAVLIEPTLAIDAYVPQSMVDQGVGLDSDLAQLGVAENSPYIIGVANPIAQLKDFDYSFGSIDEKQIDLIELNNQASHWHLVSDDSQANVSGIIVDKLLNQP